MSIARRPAKCSSACLRCAGQTRPPVQRAIASSGRRTTAEPHSGQRAGIDERLGVGRALVREHAHDLGNHVAGAPHDHGVADLHVLAPDLVLVVQRRVGHGHAADEHGLQPRDRRDRAGAPDLHVDAEHLGRHLLGRELVRDREARRARDEAEPLLQREIVDLVDDAVDVERQRLAALADRAGSSRAGPRARARRRAPSAPESGVPQEPHQRVVRGRRRDRAPVARRRCRRRRT